jgi:hypothetical protein
MLQIARFAMFGGRNMVETLDKSKRCCGGRRRGGRGGEGISGSPAGIGEPRGIHLGAGHLPGTIG